MKSKNVWNKLIVALDLESKRKIKRVVNNLYPRVKIFKIGLIGYTLCGPEIVSWIIKKGGKVFLDLKLYDIPHTISTAAKVMTRMGVWAFTVHIKAGKEALVSLKEDVAREAKEKKLTRPLIIGVTELTSQQARVSAVLRLAQVAYESGLDGVVCSVWEAEEIKKRFALKVFCPGIRKGTVADDQKRVATVKEAQKKGVDYFIAGRPIVTARDYLTAAEELLESK